MSLRAMVIAGVLALPLLTPVTADAQVKATLFVSGLSAPVEFVQDPSQPSVQVVVQLGGLVRVVQNGVLLPAPFLDLTTSVSAGGERGLLGLAFAPDYTTSGRVFVNFTNLDGHTVVARFTRSPADALKADPASRFDLRWGGPSGDRFIVQPYSNHNGGHLAFGADGYLYIGMGDGGAGGDPDNRAQDPDSLLGKMLRIDTAVPDANPEGYVVPADNPFVAGAALPEIWSFGLRNPWKFTVDISGPGSPGTNAIVMGDVGQGAREEINYEPAGVGGRNYGWRLREGLLPYLPDTPPAFLPLTEPMFDYPRTEGRSVTGGFVYRSPGLVSGFRGRYFYGDFITGRVWSLGLVINAAGEASVTGRVEHTAELGGPAVLGNISAFGTDSEGELYVVSYHGVIHKIVRDDEATGPIGGARLPFGAVDAVVMNVGGVTGAVGVTGWALDDTGVSAVGIYRPCQTGVDDPAACELVLGESVVFVGNAEFLPGKRPDVASMFPLMPNASRAGWRLQIPPDTLPQGGTTFFVVATDLDGQQKRLGPVEPPTSR